MKRLLSLVLVFMLLFSTVALVGDYSMIDFNYERTGDPEELRSSANKFIEDTFAIPNYFKEHNKEGEPLNTDSSVIERSMLVYGSPGR